MTTSQAFWTGFGTCLLFVIVFAYSVWRLRREDRRQPHEPPVDYPRTG